MVNASIALAEELYSCWLILGMPATNAVQRRRMLDLPPVDVRTWAEASADQLKRLAERLIEAEAWLAPRRACYLAAADGADCPNAACAHELPIEAARELLHVAAVLIGAAGSDLDVVALGGPRFITEFYIDRTTSVAAALERGGETLSERLSSRALFPRCAAFYLATVRGAIEREAARALPSVAPRDDAYLTCAALAAAFDVAQEPLRSRLARFRKTSLDGWIEQADPRTRASKYLYRVGAVRHIVDDLRATAKRPSRKILPDG